MSPAGQALNREVAMRCPVCKSLESRPELIAHANGIDEELRRCLPCQTLWSVNHGKVTIIEEPGPGTFLGAASEEVEGDDYNVSLN